MSAAHFAPLDCRFEPLLCAFMSELPTRGATIVRLMPSSTTLANPDVAPRATDIKGAALGKKVDAAAVNRWFKTKRRAHRFARGSGNPERPGRQMQRRCPHPRAVCNDGDQIVQRRDLAARQDKCLIRGGRVLAAEPKAFHQIVDVGQMVIDFAVSEGNPPTMRHTAEEFEQTSIAGSVNTARSYHRDFNAAARSGFARQAFPFKLRLLVDITRLERRVLVRRRVRDVAVDPDSAAVDDAAHAGTCGRVDDLSDRRR